MPETKNHLWGLVREQKEAREEWRTSIGIALNRTGDILNQIRHMPDYSQYGVLVRNLDHSLAKQIKLQTRLTLGRRVSVCGRKLKCFSKPFSFEIF